MGGRDGAGASKWLKASADWEKWAKWKYQHPRDFTPDSIDALAKNFEATNAELMKKAVSKSKYLTVNPYSHVAHYEEKENGYSVSVKGEGAGGGGIKSGVVFVDVEKKGEKSKRSFFQTHKQAVAFAEKEIRKRKAKK